MTYRLVHKRLAKERTLVNYTLSELHEEENELWWDLTVPGPDGTPYAGKTFVVRIYYESSYPFRSPRLQFQTPCFHPNLTENGYSSNLLDQPWSPSYTIATLYERIQWMLAHPIATLPYNQKAADLLQRDPVAFAAAIHKQSDQSE